MANQTWEYKYVVFMRGDNEEWTVRHESKAYKFAQDSAGNWTVAFTESGQTGSANESPCMCLKRIVSEGWSYVFPSVGTDPQKRTFNFKRPLEG